ncbi:MAG: hypothetical protein H6940_12230 [Burkholderiales bacterium]|uniref:hypothetical protein n=1 Tax=Nitrosomonas sp. TaxID=42353 RepID=UPI001D808721|nr:hypothetical protein [Nitrosomonas sp.]MCB1949414.1 hypothetical protein [Nitrosomonas sp.]MCP5244175.1 hypothetical protein [Burkholderiales bacterium]
MYAVIIKARLSIRSVFRMAFIATIVTFAVSASAHRILDIVSGAGNADGSGWQVSTDQISWIPAFAPYPNSITQPNPNLNGTPIPDGGTTNAQLMWFAGPGTNPDGMSGPDTVYFRYEFDLAAKTLMGGGVTGAWVAADDWMRLTVNGFEVGTYLLDDHMDDRGQPMPVFMDFTQYLNDILAGSPTDHNIIEIEAHDGGLTAFNRAYEWAFFDAQFIPTSQPKFLSEPAPALLVIIGLIYFGRSWGRSVRQA